MQWEIIDVPVMPKCTFCGKWTQKMARFNNPEAGEFKYICYTCAKYVRDALNDWAGPDIDYIKDIGGVFSSDNIDKAMGDKYNNIILHANTDKCHNTLAHKVSECADHQHRKRLTPADRNGDGTFGCEDMNESTYLGKYENVD